MRELTRRSQEIDQQQAVDLWDALRIHAPELAESRTVITTDVAYDNYPGLRKFLLAEFALNTPVTTIRRKIEAIREEQIGTSAVVWPTLSKMHLKDFGNANAEEWLPIRRRIDDAIVQVGVVNKNRRLASLAQMAEDIRERMWDEQNAKTGEYYLLPDYRATLELIAKEMGELGVPAESGENILGEIAKSLVDVLKVQGMGVQETSTEYDYDVEAKELP